MIRTVIHFLDSSAVGGAEQVAFAMMTGLDRRRWRPVLVHHDEPGLASFVERAEQMSVEHRVVPRMATVHDLGGMPAFLRTLRAYSPSVFHAHMTWPLSCKFGLLAAVIARVPAVVATAHTRLPIRAPLHKQPRLISRLLHRYLAVSEAVARQLRFDFGIEASKIEVVHNGIAVQSFARSRSPVLCDTNGVHRGPMVLTVARLDKGKGHTDLLDAARLVPAALFVLVGDGPERAALESKARRLGVAERVIFLGERPDVSSLLARADVFVLPSLSEGLPLAVLEAMAAEVPVVATAIPGVDEVITDGLTGLLASPNAPASLASAILRICANPEEGRALAAAAKERVQAEFSTDRMVNRVASVYEEVLAS